MPAIPLILAVDTTCEYGSLALVRGSELLEEVPVHAPLSFGPVLYEALGHLLERNGVQLADIACFAAASGPGTFTGVRIALACVKGLAEATGRPVVGVSNLEAMAAYGTAPLRAVVLDARRGDIYGAVYDRAGVLVAPEVVSKPVPWLESLPAGIDEFVATGVELPLAGTRFAGARVVTPPRAFAAVIARIAAGRCAQGQATDPAVLDANYVRRTDAELALKS